jgi:hypothetical protein
MALKVNDNFLFFILFIHFLFFYFFSGGIDTYLIFMVAFCFFSVFN